MSDDEAVREVGRRCVDAWNRHDMAAFAALFREDADFVNVYGSWWVGRARIEAEHAAVHATVFRASRLEALGMTVKSLRPDVATLHVRWTLSGIARPDGQALPDREGVLSFTLLKDDEGWTIAAGQNTDIAPAP